MYSIGLSTNTKKGEIKGRNDIVAVFATLLICFSCLPKVVVKVFDKLTGGKRERDRVHQEGDEFIELRLRPGDAYEMDGVREPHYQYLESNRIFSLNSILLSFRSCKNPTVTAYPRTTRMPMTNKIAESV